MSISFVYPQALWLLLLVPLTVGLGLFGPRRPTLRRFWGGLALRAGLLTMLVLALAGIQLRLPADTLTVVFVLDVSDSVPVEEQTTGEKFIRDVVAAMPRGDRAAVVVFGQDALVERLASEDGTLPGLTSVPVTSRTDIDSALQLALALFPDEGAKRLVLLSDGRENLGQALEQAELAGAQRIELLYVPLRGPEGEAEVRLEALEAPANARQGQDFDLVAVVHSSASQEATLRVFADGQLIHTQEVRLQEGLNRYRVPVEAGQTGFRRFRAQVLPSADTRLQNNEASAFSVIYGPPRVLIVEGQPGEATNLEDALQTAENEVVVLPAEQVPTSLAEFAAFDAVVLVNVPAQALPAGTMDALQVYVRDLGKGLLMIGGENSFGAGGYLRTALEESLPVFMDVRTQEQTANLALVLAVDKSGSMGRCHCDDPDLNQSYVRQEVGQPKVDIAKEAVMRAAGALGPQDFLGVVSFDDSAHWEMDVRPLPDPVTLEQTIGGILAAGQTNMRSGVEAAYAALQGVDARRKHVILLTDGWEHTGELSRLADEMRQEGITLSVVAAGGGSAEYLTALADSGGGTYYPAVDILRVPDFFLKETVRAVGRYIVEEPFYPLPGISSPALRGLDPARLPPLYGYNGTTPKTTARLDLVTPLGDPLLATWQYGLGRSAAWTSDMKGQWATEWVAWEDFPRFAAQLVGWLLPAPQIEGLSASTALEDGQAVIELQAVDGEGRPYNYLAAEATLVDPELGTIQAPLEQVGAGQYRAAVDVSQTGTYLVRLGVNDGLRSLGQQTLGLVVPYSPEYKESGGNLGFLEELARLTGGSRVEDIAQVFAHNLPAADFAREIWRPLLLLAALLFPLDVAVRRVILGREDLAKGRVWLAGRLGLGRQRAASGERALGQLFQARQRARQRQARPESGAPGQPPAAPSAPQNAEGSEPDSLQEPEGAPPAQDGDADTLDRLRQAKKRARRD